MPNYNLTPRESFCSNAQNVTEHHVLVENPIIRKSVDAALAEYCRKQGSMAPPDLANAALCFMRLQGAQEFVNLFYNLCETQTSPVRNDGVNLPGNVKPMSVRK